MQAPPTVVGVSRPLRIEFAGALYHVTARGNTKGRIARDEDDFRSTQRSPRPSKGMAGSAMPIASWETTSTFSSRRPSRTSRTGWRLNSLYAQRFNRRDGRVGHVFQGRFHAVLLEREAHLMELSRYVVLNPVRAGMCTAPGEWPWSSYQATAGDVPRPVFLTVDWLLEQFGTETAQAREEYRRFIAASSPARPWDDLRGQIYLGTESFIAEHVPIRANPREIARAQREPLRPSLAKILGTAASGSRLLEARSHGYRLREIGEHLGCTMSPYGGGFAGSSGRSTVRS